MVTIAVDDLDRRLITTLAEFPRIGILELARRLEVARGTAQARLDKLLRDGVITGFGPDINLPAMGYAVTAFATMEIAQGRLNEVVDHLARIPEILEAHSTTGAGDVHLKMVARTNDHLESVINRALEVPGIVRITTVISLSEQIPFRVLPLVDGSNATK